MLPFLPGRRGSRMASKWEQPRSTKAAGEHSVAYPCHKEPVILWPVLPHGQSHHECNSARSRELGRQMQSGSCRARLRSRLWTTERSPCLQCCVSTCHLSQISIMLSPKANSGCDFL